MADDAEQALAYPPVALDEFLVSSEFDRIQQGGVRDNVSDALLGVIECVGFAAELHEEGSRLGIERVPVGGGARVCLRCHGQRGCHQQLHRLRAQVDQRGYQACRRIDGLGGDPRHGGQPGVGEGVEHDLGHEGQGSFRADESNAPYRHYPDKEALLAALAAQTKRRAVEALSTAGISVARAWLDEEPSDAVPSGSAEVAGEVADAGVGGLAFRAA